MNMHLHIKVHRTIHSEGKTCKVMVRVLKVVASLSRTSIPKALREQTWLRYNGSKFTAKCNVDWCTNKITPFTFEVGHNVPVSKGGTTDIDNLRPICPGCNRSMGNKYTIDQFSQLSKHRQTNKKHKCACLSFSKCGTVEDIMSTQ